MAATRLLAPGERPLYELRPHVSVLARPVLLLLVLGPATGLAVGLVEGTATARVVVGLLGLAAIGRWVVWPFLEWWNTVHLVTDRRIVIREGVLTRLGHDVPYRRVVDVRIGYGVVERVLGCGTLFVDVAGEDSSLVLARIPRVEEVQGVLFRCVEAVRDAHRAERAAHGRAEEPFGEPEDDDARDATVVLEAERVRQDTQVLGRRGVPRR